MSTKQKHFAHDIYEYTINRKDYLNKISQNDLISCINKIVSDIEINNIHENIELCIITRLLSLYTVNTLRLLDTKTFINGTPFKNYAVYFDNIPFNLQIDENILNLVNGKDDNKINSEDDKSFEDLSSTKEIDLLLSKNFKGVDGFQNLLTEKVSNCDNNDLLGYNDGILNTKYAIFNTKYTTFVSGSDNCGIGINDNNNYPSFSFFNPNMKQKRYNNFKFLKINESTGEIIEVTGISAASGINGNEKVQEKEVYTIFILYNKITKHCNVFKYNLQQNSQNIINKIIYDYFDIWFGNEFVFIETLKSSDIIVDFDTVYNDFANRDFMNRNEVIHRYEQCIKKYLPQKMELSQEVQIPLKEVQLTIDQYCSIIRKYYNIDNNIENRVRSTELSTSMIEKINKDLAEVHQYVDEEHFISRFIDVTSKLGLCKKRYAAGNYYYGISEKIDAKQNTVFDTLNIKKEDCNFDPSKYESDVLKMIKNMESELNKFKSMIKKNDDLSNISPKIEKKPFILEHSEPIPIIRNPVNKLDIYPGMKLQPFILEQN
jgi:hypothetical protein